MASVRFSHVPEKKFDVNLNKICLVFGCLIWMHLYLTVNRPEIIVSKFKLNKFLE